MASRFEQFDPDNCDKAHMNYLADLLENWITVLESTMIIPEDVMEDVEESVKEGNKRIRKLIKKLRAGDRSVFIDDDEYSCLYQ